MIGNYILKDLENEILPSVMHFLEFFFFWKFIVVIVRVEIHQEFESEGLNLTVLDPEDQRYFLNMCSFQ